MGGLKRVFKHSALGESAAGPDALSELLLSGRREGGAGRCDCVRVRRRRCQGCKEWAREGGGAEAEVEVEEANYRSMEAAAEE